MRRASSTTSRQRALRISFVAAALGLLVAPLGITFSSRSASAATVDVFPGVGTLQAAIDAASDGDHLRVHPGTYTGAVSVTKRLGIRLVVNPVVDNTSDALIDANCAAPVALDIAADDVKMTGLSHFFGAGIGVFGGTTTQIRIANHNNVKLQGINAYPRTPVCGSEQEGIEVSGSSSKVQLVGVFASEFPGAGVQLSGLSVGARILVKASGRFGGDMIDNAIGLLIENSANGAGLGAAGSRCSGWGSLTTASRAFVVNSDGVAIQKNALTDNSPVTGAVGIDLDATSDANLIRSNMWTDTTGMNTAFVDNGSGNCGTGNNFAVPPCP